eukprot:459964_1
MPIHGVEEMGPKFKRISEKYLHMWDRKYLCRVYNRKIMQRLKTAEKLKENLQLAKPPGQSEVFDVPPQLYEPHLVIQGNTKLEDVGFCIDDLLDPQLVSSSPPLALTSQPLGSSDQLLGSSDQLLGFSDQLLGSSHQLLGSSDQLMGYIEPP